MNGLFSQVPQLDDPALEQVAATLSRDPALLSKVGQALRTAFDEVIDAPRTGRFCIDQLEKTEKTYIGTKVEILLRKALALERGVLLDNLIAGHEVDTKFTVKNDWMIPQEAVGQLCMLVRADDVKGLCWLGLLRMAPAVLTNGQNRDGKKSISAAGKAQIRWLVEGPMPRNFMLDLPEVVRSAILAQPSGRQRVRALFTMATGLLIPRDVIEQLAQQRDAVKRAREMKETLGREGYQVLCATYLADREIMIAHGFTPAAKDEWLSLRISDSP
ncbi:NaeI family type II restriction endonuclease [Stenotrophomonas geniculata]|uniref:NaeI family type II restriction endonuclease n=1 Tax=Stenotrophomonas geniculata TaxID=86188 RepID=UPI001311DACF|nr:NaeI family type II restriction endonuclease [Stenotrophomonas geniculata]